jgi:hypothetical protein
LILAENEAAYFEIDRNASFSLADLSELTIAPITNIPLNENVYIFAYRLADTSVWLWDGAELIEGNNLSIGTISEILSENAYDEPLTVVSGVPANSNEVAGPILAGAVLTLPNDSNDNDSPQSYVNGQGVLEVYLNGVVLVKGVDWAESGVAGDVVFTFQILIDLVVDDVIHVRIDTTGGYVDGSAGGGGGDVTAGQNVGTGALIYKQKLGTILQFKTLLAGSNIFLTEDANEVTISQTAGTVLQIVEKNSSYLLTSFDDVILVDATGGDVTISLPAAATVSGKKYDIKKIDASGFSVVIDADASETIDDLTTQSTNVQYESFSIVSNGTAWFII